MPLIAGMLQFHRPGAIRYAPRAVLHALVVRERRVLHAKRDRADARAVHARERLRKRIRFGVDDEVDAALPVQQHVLGAMLGDCREAHPLELPSERGGVRRRVFDEFEAVGPERVVPQRRGVGRAHD
jgi:hypothetical protein